MDNKPKLIMMTGIAGSGKSTYAKELANKYNAVIHSSDSLRDEMFGINGFDFDNGQHKHNVFEELNKRVKRDLSEGKNVIYDSTNTTYKKRRGLVDSLKKIECEKICVLVATPYELCLKQNSEREIERVVPEYILRKMYTNFYIPQKYEGWDKIEIKWNTQGMLFDTNELFNGEEGLNNISQDNPNHTLTIGHHCQKCGHSVEELGGDNLLCIAGLYHDIGKRFTKEFKNGKGEDVGIAHYYQHHLVGAYTAMFYLKESGFETETILEICNYIQWHMQFYFIDTPKLKKKFIRLVGEEFYNKLELLNQADKMSK